MLHSYSCKRLYIVVLSLALVAVFSPAFSQSGSWSKQASLMAEPPGTADAAVFTINGIGYMVGGIDSNGYSDAVWEISQPFDQWSQKIHFPGGGRAQAVAFSINGKGYVGTGAGKNGLKNDFWEYDPETGTWTKKADFPGGPRQSAVAFSIAEKGYIGTGYNGQYLSDFYEYDPASNTWSQIPSLPGTGRMDAVAFSIDNKGYVSTGKGVNYLNDFWEYDPAINKWTRKPDFPGSARSNAVAGTFLTYAYIGTGTSTTETDDFWEYDASSGTWTSVAPVPGSIRQAAAAFQYGSSDPVIALGKMGNQLLKDFWRYNHFSNSWSKLAQPHGARVGAVALTIGGAGYVLTGNYIMSNRKDVWAYDPVANSWKQKADFGGIARSGAAGFAIGDKAYVGTGEGGWYPGLMQLNDFWEYNKSSDKWTRKGDFPGGTRGGALAFTINGKGYFGFGYAPSGNTLVAINDLWQYDPLPDKWIRKSDPPFVPGLGASSFVIGDKVYVTVARNTGVTSKQLWEYDSQADKWTRKSDFPGRARSGATTFTIGNNAYYGLGQIDYEWPEDPFTDDIWKYSQPRNEWVQIANFPTGDRSGAIAFTIGNVAYTGFGYAPMESIPDYMKNDLWKFTPSNQPPIAAGFVMMYYYPNAHLLNAWGSYDPEGGPVKFLWKKTGGPSPYKMLYENASTPVISDLVTGTYTFQLTVTDQEGATATADVSFSVKVNQPPIANGFAMMYYYPNAHLLNAWGSYDPDGGPVKFWWTKIAGPTQYHMLYPEASTPVISNLTAGKYSFQLSVTDQEGATAYDTVDIIQTTPLSHTSNNRRSLTEFEHQSLINNKLIISPNPVNEQLNLKWNSDYVGEAKLTVMDMSGKVVKVQQLKKERPEQWTFVALNGLKSGSYHLVITLENGKSLSLKFVKH